MPTARELRFQAKECLELANTANQPFVKTALIELARKLSREAHQVEHRERVMAAAFSNLQAS
jgi:hypothetical protein